MSVFFSYAGSLLLFLVRPRLSDMVSPEATETPSHTDRDRESECKYKCMKSTKYTEQHNAFSKDYNTMTRGFFIFCLTSVSCVSSMEMVMTCLAQLCIMIGSQNILWLCGSYFCVSFLINNKFIHTYKHFLLYPQQLGLSS